MVVTASLLGLVFQQQGRDPSFLFVVAVPVAMIYGTLAEIHIARVASEAHQVAQTGDQ